MNRSWARRSTRDPAALGEQESEQGLSRADFLPTGRRVVQAGPCLRPTWGRDRARWGPRPVRPHDMFRPATWRTRGPAAQTTPGLASPAACLSWPEYPFSVVLKQRAAVWVSCWKNVKAWVGQKLDWPQRGQGVRALLTWVSSGGWRLDSVTGPLSSKQTDPTKKSAADGVARLGVRRVPFLGPPGGR